MLIIYWFIFGTFIGIFAYLNRNKNRAKKTERFLLEVQNENFLKLENVNFSDTVKTSFTSRSVFSNYSTFLIGNEYWAILENYDYLKPKSWVTAIVSSDFEVLSRFQYIPCYYLISNTNFNEKSLELILINYKHRSVKRKLKFSRLKSEQFEILKELK